MAWLRYDQLLFCRDCAALILIRAELAASNEAAALLALVSAVYVVMFATLRRSTIPRSVKVQFNAAKFNRVLPPADPADCSTSSPSAALSSIDV
jgi:hypothetical protein